MTKTTLRSLTKPQRWNLDYRKTVSANETARNQSHLVKLVNRVKNLSQIVANKIAESQGALNKQDDPDKQESWMENFYSELLKHEEFDDIVLDIMENIERRCELVKTGKFERGATGWPTVWSFTENARDKFLEQVRWFSSNHSKQFGRLLTPLVDGIRVQGPISDQKICLSSQNWC